MTHEAQSSSALLLGLPPSSYVCRVVCFSLNPYAHILALAFKAMLSKRKPMALDFFADYFKFYFLNYRKY